MKVILTLIIMGLLMEGAFTWVATLILPADSRYPEQCYNADANETHDVGSMWQYPDQCTRHSCRKSGSRYSIHIEGCSAIAKPPSPCRLESDRKQQYPKCCPRLAC
ncbi:U-scoloptoxin(16)-Er13a [Anabrus simplex]|uniref:U-scoloptoxin(16)-Er13a n=1 Tax=Anabrus simplex TaxID=316456 RepID=UPI0035A27E6C